MKTYTQEQLNTMTPAEMMAAILEMQAQGAVIVTIDPATADIAQQSDLPAIVNFTADQLAAMTKEDLLKAKDDFKATAEATILEIEQKIAEKESEVKAEVEQIGTKLVTSEKSFIQKYGQAIAHGIEILLLATIAGKLLGVL